MTYCNYIDIKNNLRLLLPFFIIASFLSISIFGRAQNTILVGNTKCVKVPAGYYVGEFEVSTLDWLQYMVVTSLPATEEPIILADKMDLLHSKLPDLKTENWCTTTFQNLLKKDKKLHDLTIWSPCAGIYYHIMVSDEGWREIKKLKLTSLPISGISFEQVNDFLAYKQEEYNHCRSAKTEQSFHYEFFLPTPDQFNSVRLRQDSLNSKLCPMFNFRNSFCQNCPGGKSLAKDPVKKLAGTEPVYIDSYFPNDYGLYNIRGNVAEMTSTKGVAMGGSYYHAAEEAYGDKSQHYSGLEPWLGLRYWIKLLPKQDK